MRPLAGLAGVAIISALNLYVGVPAGYGFGLSPTQTGAAALIGSVGATVALVFLGDGIVPRLRRARDVLAPAASGMSRRGRTGGPPADDAEPSGRVRRLANRYGAPGLGIIGPLTIGGFASAISGVALGYPKVKLAVWLAIGQTLVVVAYLVLIDVAVA